MVRHSSDAVADRNTYVETNLQTSFKHKWSAQRPVRLPVNHLQGCLTCGSKFPAYFLSFLCPTHGVWMKSADANQRALVKVIVSGRLQNTSHVQIFSSFAKKKYDLQLYD